MSELKVGDRVYLNHIVDKNNKEYTGAILAINGIRIHIKFDIGVKTYYDEEYVSLLQVTMVDVLVHNKEYKDARKVLNV